VLTGRLPFAGLHPFVWLATDAIVAYLEQSRTPPPDVGLLERFEELRRRAGVFVTLRKRGELRGCMGTYEATKENIALEIIENAIAAAFRDPRFHPLSTADLPSLCISVDILKPAERISDPAELNPSRYGVIVQQGVRRGLLLPDLDDVTSIEEQVAIAREKAGIGNGDAIELYRFEVDRYR
jgi:AmmeMemoRadiSam system protein A